MLIPPLTPEQLYSYVDEATGIGRYLVMAASLPLWGFWYLPPEIREQAVYSTWGLQWM